MPSIRGFLTTLLLATIVLAAFVSVLQGYKASSQEIQQQMDFELVDLAELLTAQQINNGNSAIYVGKKIAFQIINVEQGAADDLIANDQQISPLKQEFQEVNFRGYRWRSYSLFNDEKKLWVTVAERLDIRFDLAEKIILKSLIPVVLEVFFVAALIWFIVGYALKPLYSLSKSLKNKRENDLSPLNVGHPYKEVEQLTQSINSLLRRLEQSFDREKRFASDVAHELRTPLSVLKVDFFNLSQVLDDDNPEVQALSRGIDRMEHLIQQILTLYRTTPDRFMATFTHFDFYVLAQKAIAEQYEKIDAKFQTVELRGETSILFGEQATLEILLVNLIENANKYTPVGGSIKLSVFDSRNSIVLQVEDSGVGIVESQYDRVFERFYRVDGDCHTSNIQGCGIGLSIVKHIADLHNATIKLQHSSHKTGLMVRVNFPRDKSND